MHIVIWTDEKKERAISMLTKYFEKYSVGEVIMQSDNALIEAPEILSDIVDEILIEGEGIIYKEDE